jgi:hypothetical protein
MGRRNATAVKIDPRIPGSTANPRKGLARVFAPKSRSCGGPIPPSTGRVQGGNWEDLATTTKYGMVAIGRPSIYNVI